MTRSMTAVHTRDSPPRRAAAAQTGMRPFSTRSPSQASIAGRTVSEATIASATTIIVPIANETNAGSPLMNMPAIAAITVRPETSTARPEVAAAISSASRWPVPGGPLLALSAQVEERVVDADREADQQDHGGDAWVDREDLARERDERRWRRPRR